MSYFGFVIACLVDVGSGSYLYASAAAKCLEASFLSINKKAHRKTQRTLIRGQFVETLQFHSRMMQLSETPINIRKELHNGLKFLRVIDMIYSKK